MQIRNIIKLPVVLVALIMLAMFILGSMSPGYTFALHNAVILSSVMFTFGIFVIVIGGYSFKKVNTTVNPVTPELSTQLVTTGIYKISRNPMYIGFLIWLIACVIFVGSLINLLLLPIFIFLANRLYIFPEEKALEKLFKDQYTEYKNSVRRWL